MECAFVVLANSTELLHIEPKTHALWKSLVVWSCMLDEDCVLSVYCV